MVTLQEANAVAIRELAMGTFTDIVPLCLKDWTGLQIDVSDQDGGMTWSPIRTSSACTCPMRSRPTRVVAETNYVMANEGDDRDYFLASDETIPVSND